MRLRILIVLLFVCFSSVYMSEAVEAKYDAVTARRADDFFNSIGVNTHFGYGDTNYRLYEERLKPRLLELGVKHIREDGRFGWRPDVIAKFREVGAHGIKMLVIARAEGVRKLVEDLGDMLWGLEGENEPDISRSAYPTWPEYARKQQQKLYDTIKSAYSWLPVVGVSLANCRDSPARLGDISDLMDYGSIHPYAAGQPPMNHWGWGMSMNTALEKARIANGDKPLIATECGYHNRIGNKGHPGVSEKAAAIYHVCLPFVYFNQGIVRSYKYEFLDLRSDPDNEEMEYNFGLIRWDGTPKPSFYALKNLLAIVKDSDDPEDFSPGSLSFAIEAPERVYSTLLQKSDGSFWLALFRNVTVYDTEKLKDIEVEPIEVSLRLRKKAREIEVYVPNNSDQPSMEFRNSRRLSLPLGKELVILKID